MTEAATRSPQVAALEQKSRLTCLKTGPWTYATTIAGFLCDTNNDRVRTIVTGLLLSVATPLHLFKGEDFLMLSTSSFDMPIIFWVTVYVESISRSAKKVVTCQHVDRTATLHTLTMDYFLTPGEIHLAEGKVYNINGSCLFQTNIAPMVFALFQLIFM